MAKVCSEVGFTDIVESDGGLGHTEDQPEIEVDKPIGDFNKVCCLETRDYNEILERLKNNPGVVAKSLGAEGQTVSPVAVVDGETKKSKPPTSECTHEGLREAAINSDWYHALCLSDCKTLMSLLQDNPCLVVEMGPGGYTVLHAAAERGCLELLDQVFNLFMDKRFVDETFVKVGLNALCNAKYGLFQAEAYLMAFFTCSSRVWWALEPFTSSATQSFIQRGWRSNENQHLVDKLVELIEGETSNESFINLTNLARHYTDRDYDFVSERKELLFHIACKRMEEYWPERVCMKTIIDRCLQLGLPESSEVLTYLLQLHNAQGKTPFHVALIGSRIRELLALVPTGDAYKECMNAKDVRGWTTLHFAATGKTYDFDLKALLEDERIDANARTSPKEIIYYSEKAGYPMTALHLAILHNNVRGVEILLKCPRTDVDAQLQKDIRFSRDLLSPFWSPLQLAAIMGLSDVVKALLRKLDDIYDDGKLQNKICMKEKFQTPSALLLASASENPDTLRLFLDHPKFNPLVTFEGATTLHYATNAMIPTTPGRYNDPKVGRFLFLSDLPYLDCNTCRYEEELEDVKLTPTSYLGRQACITMLLQSGVDIWEKDDEDRLANPGPQAPEQAHLWWHEKMAQETLEAKKSLNDAANAISVVAALVATASFVGPLQPPLGYGGDSMEGGIQDTFLSVRIFMVSNILSFYLAVASILFAVVPSLPMPQEGIFAEWQRTRRTVGVAIFFLLMSVLGVLISFGAASNSVVSKSYSWQHLGLSFYPTLVGGFICILGISLFFLRLLRLIFNRNAKIRYLYKTFVKF